MSKNVEVATLKRPGQWLGPWGGDSIMYHIHKKITLRQGILGNPSASLRQGVNSVFLFFGYTGSVLFSADKKIGSRENSPLRKLEVTGKRWSTDFYGYECNGLFFSPPVLV